MHRKNIPLLILVAFQIGCAEQTVYQEPAPVYRSHPAVATRQTPKAVEIYSYPEEAATQPLPKMEEITPDDAQPLAPAEPVALPDVSAPSVPPATEAAIPAVAPPAAPEIPALPPVSMASFSPAILALATEADQNAHSGQYESAGAKIERALRIDPRNAILTYKLASIRLKQEQPRLAEDLAKKAALLAGTDRDIKKRSWLLIAESRRMQNDPDGAQQAQQKALQF
jgi:tetratricopeptide (TPR) repeat protein